MSSQTYFSSLVIKYSVCILLKITKIYFSRSGFSLLESVLIGILILFILAIGPSSNVRTSTLTNGSIHLRMDQVKLVEDRTLCVTHLSLDTGLKLNVQKTFRRRPRHLLSVLCTLNLRPVSRGFRLTSFFITIFLSIL